MDDATKKKFDERGLLAISQDVVMSCTGAADPMPFAELEAAVNYLILRIGHWEPSRLERQRRYDEAVRALVTEAVWIGTGEGLRRSKTER